MGGEGMEKGRGMSLANLGRLILALLLLLGLSGCAKSIRSGGAVSVAVPDFFGLGEELAAQLSLNERHRSGPGERLIFTTLVSLDDLYQTSRFGRALSEALATRLFQHGYNVVEIRKAGGILLKDKRGELILSRDAAQLAKSNEAEVIVAGTYVVTAQTVIINIKFLDATSQEVLSVAGLELQRSQVVNSMLQSGEGGSATELSGYER